MSKTAIAPSSPYKKRSHLTEISNQASPHKKAIALNPISTNNDHLFSGLISTIGFTVGKTYCFCIQKASDRHFKSWIIYFFGSSNNCCSNSLRQQFKITSASLDKIRSKNSTCINLLLHWDLDSDLVT